MPYIIIFTTFTCHLPQCIQLSLTTKSSEFQQFGLFFPITMQVTVFLTLMACVALVAASKPRKEKGLRTNKKGSNFLCNNKKVEPNALKYIAREWEAQFVENCGEPAFILEETGNLPPVSAVSCARVGEYKSRVACSVDILGIAQDVILRCQTNSVRTKKSETRNYALQTLQFGIDVGACP
eukprot:m.351257 g.351257  ORF g.351257 m.351257 type:complete len:181 (-) comp16206_c0_seq1:136-678(-)